MTCPSSGTRMNVPPRAFDFRRSRRPPTRISANSFSTSWPNMTATSPARPRRWESTGVTFTGECEIWGSLLNNRVHRKVVKKRRREGEENLRVFAFWVVALIAFNRCHREPAFFHECFHLRVAAAEVTVSFRGVDRVADGEDVLDEALPHLLVVRSFAFGECTVSVRRDHVRPEIAVISGRIAIARERVPELRRAVAHHQLPRHPESRERFALEFVRIDLLRAGQVQLHVDQGTR